MNEAEEACSRALHIKPSCAKALFRRGQARLALGRVLDAASDFRAVIVLEPGNVEATKMLHRAQQKEESSTNANGRPLAEKVISPASRVLVPAEGVYQQPRRSSLEEHSNAELQSTTPASPQLSAVEVEMTTNNDACLGEGNTPTTPPPPVAISTTTHSSGSGAPPPPENSSSSSSGCDVANVHAEEEYEEESGKKAGHNSVEASSTSSPTSAPCFLVSGWLTSTEREQAGQQQQQQQQIDEGKHVGIYHPSPNATTNNDRAKVDDPAGGAKGAAVSVSRLVSQLSASQEAASSERDPPSASSTTTAAALAEWSLLQAEEKMKVKESVRRWSPGLGLRPQDRSTVKATATTTGVKGIPTHQKRRNVHGTKKKRSAAKETEQGRGAVEERRTAALWAALEEEENKVRETFRVKLGLGDKPSTKKKAQDRKKKSTAVMLRAKAA